MCLGWFPDRTILDSHRRFARQSEPCTVIKNHSKLSSICECCPLLVIWRQACQNLLQKKIVTYLRFDRWKKADFELKQDAGRPTEAQA